MVDDIPPPAKPKGADPGAVLVTGQIVVGNMTWYVVDETKLENLSSQNDDSRAFFATAAAFLSFAAGLFVQQFFTTPLSEKAWVVCFVVAPLCLVVAVIAAILGLLRYFSGKSTLRAIKANKATTNIEINLSARS